MKAYYDLHLHSCLSPCGDEDMTPENIVNMAALLGLQVIALTDHNSALNCPAAVKAGEKSGVCVIAGMELSTAEDIHMVCLFPNAAAALRFSDYVRSVSLHIENKPEIYGRQIIMGDNDVSLGEEKELLITASGIGVDDAYDTVASYGGFCYPAHIDRNSYSITAVLGDLSAECNHGVAGISYDADTAELKRLYSIDGVKLIQSSDAHYLENMKEAKNSFEIPEISAAAVIEYLKSDRS